MGYVRLRISKRKGSINDVRDLVERYARIWRFGINDFTGELEMIIRPVYRDSLKQLNEELRKMGCEYEIKAC